MLMHMWILAARLSLAAVFTIAVTAKLADTNDLRHAVEAFGVPRMVAAILAPTMIATEFGVAVLLLTAPRYGALAALTVLTGFSAAVLANIARGRRLECHCFGRLSNGPIGWPTLARNGCLAGLAAIVASDGQFIWPLMALMSVMLILWTGPTSYRRWKARPGNAAAGLALWDREGDKWTLDRLLQRRKPLVLIFSQPGCGACEQLLPDVVAWQRDERITVALINGGHSADHSVPFELIDEQRASFAAYNITATPSAVLIDGDVNVVAAQARGAAAIGVLVGRAVQMSEQISDMPGFNRRGLLRRATVGMASVSALSAATYESAGKSSAAPDVNALEVDGAWLCNQTFALCTTAPCVPSATDPNISVCDCVVVNGYSVGFKSCSERAQSGRKVRSAFSTVNVNPNFAVLSCPSGVPWANCLDVECEIDPTNPAVAKCQCVTVTTGESLTFGGACETATCTSTIWSAATPDLPGSAQYRKGMKQLNQPVTFPATCPAPK